MKTEIFPAEKDEMSDDLKTIERTVSSDYKYGFVTDIEADEAPKGLTEDTIRFISAKKKRTRLDAGMETEKHFVYWLTLEAEEPKWAM
jgi:Fe-S cluster assembly protein SufB